MTTSPAPPTSRGLPGWADRSWLLVLAPLVGVGWLPWWSVLGLTLALAVSRGEEVQRVRGPLLLLGGGLGLLVLLPQLRGVAGAAAFTRLFLTVMGGTVLVALAVSVLEDRRTGWGAAWLSILLLLTPLLGGPPLALAPGLLALLLTLLGAGGPEARPRLQLERPGGALLVVVGGAVLAAGLVGVLALTLRPAAAPVPQPTVTAAAPLPAARSPRPAPVQHPGPLAVRPPGTPEEISRVALPGGDLVLLGGLLLVLALTFLLLRGRAARGGGRPQWWEWLAAAGVVVFGVLLALFAAAAQSGSGGGVGSGLPGPGGAPGAAGSAAGRGLASAFPWMTTLLWWLSVISFLVLTTLAGLVVWLALRVAPEPREEAAAAPLPEENVPGEPVALHRVRLAYRAALASLAAAGLGRGAAETPAEHAGRAARGQPALAGPLGTLVTAYAPVRYGGRVTDEDADRAEAAAREVAALTRTPSPSESETR